MEDIITLILVIIWLVVFTVPIVKILQRVGFSGWWCILWFIPLVGIIAMWIFAFTRWPIDEQTGPAEPASGSV